MVQTGAALELEGQARMDALRKRAAEAEMERNHRAALMRTHRSVSMESLTAQLAYGSFKPRGWRRLEVAINMQPVLLETMVSAQVEDALRTDTSHVITSFSSGDTLAETPKWMQGDTVLAEKHNLYARFALRSHPLVRDALEPWWHTAQTSMQADGGDGFRLSRQEYLRIFTSVFTVRPTAMSAEQVTTERGRAEDVRRQVARKVSSGRSAHRVSLGPALLATAGDGRGRLHRGGGHAEREGGLGSRRQGPAGDGAQRLPRFALRARRHVVRPAAPRPKCERAVSECPVRRAECAWARWKVHYRAAVLRGLTLTG